MRGVIVGVDGSQESNDALDWGLREAAIRDLPLCAVLVWEPSWSDGPTPIVTGDMHPMAAERGRQVQAILGEAVQRTGVSVEARAVEIQGSAAATLLALAQEEEGAPADMVVLGRRGMGRFGHLVLGSVSSTVTQHATVPVTVVHHARPKRGSVGTGGAAHVASGVGGTSTGSAVTKPVVVGVDSSDSSINALRHAAHIAGLLGAPLEALFCWQMATLAPLPDSHGWAPPLEEYERFAAKALDGAIAAAEVGLPDAQVVRSARHIAPGKGIIEASATAERIVIGSRGLGGFDRLLLGSVSRQAVEYAYCPVTVIRTLPSATSLPDAAA